MPQRVPGPILSGFFISSLSYFPFCSHRNVSYHTDMADLHIIFNVGFSLPSAPRLSFSSRPFLYKNLIYLFRESLSFGEYTPFTENKSFACPTDGRIVDFKRANRASHQFQVPQHHSAFLF